MAIRGRKRIPRALRLIKGGHLTDRPPPPDHALPSGSLERPVQLRGAPAKLWDAYIARAYWLSWADVPKAFMWCHLQAEYEKKPTEMIASRIAQLRAVSSELGFDQSSRTRMGIISTLSKPKDKYMDDDAPTADKYFT